jgi:hypothetical protein
MALRDRIDRIISAFTQSTEELGQVCLIREVDDATASLFLSNGEYYLAPKLEIAHCYEPGHDLEGPYDGSTLLRFPNGSFGC